MDIEDIWPDGIDRAGHVAGAWDCPCDPWVKTEDGHRTVRHVAPDRAT